MPPIPKTFVQKPVEAVDDRFPTNLYRLGGPHFGPVVGGKSTTYETSGAVMNEEELEVALEAGFCRTLPEAVGLVPPGPKPSEVRAQAEAEAAAEQKRFDDAVAEKVAAELAKKGGKPVPEKAEPESAREALEAEAKSLGIAYAANMSDKTLQEKIAAKKAS